MGGVAFARQFDENFGLRDGVAVRLDRGLGEAESVDALFDGLQRLGDRVPLQFGQRRVLHVHAVIGGVYRGESPVGELLGDHVAEDLGFGLIDTVQVDLDGIGVFQGFRVVTVETVDDDVARAGFLTQRFDRLFRLGLGGVLDLHLEHQMAAALQIEPEMDVAGHIGFQPVDGPGEADDAKDTDQHGRYDYDRFHHQISLHASVFCLIARFRNGYLCLRRITSCLPEAR